MNDPLKQKFNEQFIHFQGKCNTLLTNFYNSLMGAYNFPDKKIKELEEKIDILECKICHLINELQYYKESGEPYSGLAIDLTDPLGTITNQLDVRISRRVYNCLTSENIKTVGDLINFPQKDLLKIPNLGFKSYRELIRVLKENGLRFSRK